MPKAKFPKLLSAAYSATLSEIDNFLPTRLLPAGTTAFRYFDKDYFAVDNHRHILRRDKADAALIVRQAKDADHRWTGPSHDPKIPTCEGLYCALQQQAIVNELAHYVHEAGAHATNPTGAAARRARLPRAAMLNSKCVIKVALVSQVVAPDFSPHNAGAARFMLRVSAKIRAELSAAGKGWRTLIDAINDPVDCSAARGIGLALAKAGYRAMIAETARTSERSALERGDNIIFFGADGTRVSLLTAIEAYLFPLVPIDAPPEVFPVEF